MWISAPPALPKRADRCSISLKLFEERAWSGVALSWQVAILKILSASEDGEAPVAAVTRALSILVSDGWDRKLRGSIASSHTLDIFSDGLADRPAKGVWRILPAGRDYLHALENPLELKQAAE
jgi:hypothetical protein